MDNKSLIKTTFQNYGLTINDEQISKMDLYIDLLIEWNKKINLTAIIDPKEIVVKHFIDSASILKYLDLSEKKSVIDIGTGAGFPGVVIKLLRPDFKLTLLDSLNKRLVFLDELLRSLEIDAALIHSRAEDGVHKNDFREKFDLVTSRAVANMNVLIEYCLPYVKVGGVFCPLKGPKINEELECIKNSVDLLGGKIKRVEHFNLPDDSARSIVIIKKIKKTPMIYPRKSNKILKSPLE